MKCPVCEEDINIAYASEYRAKNKPFLGKKLMRCATCDLLFVYPMPGQKELDDYYKNLWLTDESIMSTSSESEKAFKIQAEYRVEHLLKYVDPEKQNKFLDIGSGFGYYFDALIRRSVGSEYYAQDPNLQNQQRLKDKGIKVYSDINDLKEKDFDVVSAFCVLEHVPHPKMFIEIMKSTVKKNGIIFIDMPCRDDLFKRCLEPHLLFFSHKSLQYLIEKSGLKTIHLSEHGVSVSDVASHFRSGNDFYLSDGKPLSIKDVMRKIWFKLANMFLFSSIRDASERRLSGFYRYNQEGTGRWWIWALAKTE